MRELPVEDRPDAVAVEEHVADAVVAVDERHPTRRGCARPEPAQRELDDGMRFRCEAAVELLVALELGRRWRPSGGGRREEPEAVAVHVDRVDASQDRAELAWQR